MQAIKWEVVADTNLPSKAHSYFTSYYHTFRRNKYQCQLANLAWVPIVAHMNLIWFSTPLCRSKKKRVPFRQLAEEQEGRVSNVPTCELVKTENIQSK